MTFFYIVKKLAQKWIDNMAKGQIAQMLVAQETLSIHSVKQTLTEENQCCSSN
ncbi:hypothetical protein AADZ91_07135 [Colwelliaceae bacterium 6441]